MSDNRVCLTSKVLIRILLMLLCTMERDTENTINVKSLYFAYCCANGSVRHVWKLSLWRNYARIAKLIGFFFCFVRYMTELFLSIRLIDCSIVFCDIICPRLTINVQSPHNLKSSKKTLNNSKKSTTKQLENYAN